MKWKFNRVQMDQIGGKKKMKQSSSGRYFYKTLKVKVTEKKIARSGKLSGQAV